MDESLQALRLSVLRSHKQRGDAVVVQNLQVTDPHQDGHYSAVALEGRRYVYSCLCERPAASLSISSPCKQPDEGRSSRTPCVSGSPPLP